jgi:FlaA1/EpsC-like NDP-sugar epimerase
MSIQDAVYLVLKSANLAKGGEVFVLKMKAVRILDLIKAVIELVAPRFGYRPEDIEIKKIGAKPGEKLYEELMNSEEITHAWELKDMFVILPRFKDFYKGRSYEYPDLVSKKVDKPYISAEEEFLSIDEIKRYLTEHKIIEYAMEGEL